MKIKLLPFDEAVKQSKKCNINHLSVIGYMCIGINKTHWKDNAILKVISVSENGRFLCNDGFYYCECCCEVIEDEKLNS